MVMKKRYLAFIFIISVTCLVSGCDFLSPVKTQPLSSYTICNWHASAISHAKKTQSRNTLLVTTPIAAPGYATRKMVYVTIPFKLKAFANHDWVAPPAQLLLPLMVSALEKTRYFHAVVTTPYTGLSQFQLNTQLLMLQQEFLKPDSNMHLMLQATLLNSSTDQVVATRLFDISVPAQENTPYGGVLAANKASIKMSQALAMFVVRAIRKQT